ncbi:2,5-diamino-6-ribosylamino-4(3H)-pyrimidinone 5'-phosphate reductase [Streptomyces jeddahensis]|uniref:2,5-diamino-6-ribosylamino-4(3H)-pyrimidinone 5'-phosphate reductase n=2 Tax=Streptomyces jeddahensis TaxID=1716141 RepID=A0A177HX37_9ACTN|nr:2,5-diamino-6-ribosylamino-4(3H)-pyrimidinone 5'-phosphate reductase [Streptomyces jeddahensis]
MADGTDSAADRTGSAAVRARSAADRPGSPESADREWGLEELAEAYAYPEERDVWLRANMVSTLDGAAQYEGRSAPISCETDMRIFGTLRGLADAVVVGAETVRLEGYRPARAREAFAARRAAAGQGPAPAIAVVSAGLELDFSLPLFAEPLVPTLVVTGAAAPPARLRAAEKAGVEVVIAGEGAGAEPARIVRALADRGLRRLLTEGGPRLLGQFVAADALDELCLTLSPMLAAGAAQRIVGGPEVDVLKRFSLASLLEDTGFLFARYRRNRHAVE